MANRLPVFSNASSNSILYHDLKMIHIGADVGIISVNGLASSHDGSQDCAGKDWMSDSHDVERTGMERARKRTRYTRACTSHSHSHLRALCSVSMVPKGNTRSTIRLFASSRCVITISPLPSPFLILPHHHDQSFQCNHVHNGIADTVPQCASTIILRVILVDRGAENGHSVTVLCILSYPHWKRYDYVPTQPNHRAVQSSSNDSGYPRLGIIDNADGESEYDSPTWLLSTSISLTPQSSCVTDRAERLFDPGATKAIESTSRNAGVRRVEGTWRRFLISTQLVIIKANHREDRNNIYIAEIGWTCIAGFPAVNSVESSGVPVTSAWSGNWIDSDVASHELFVIGGGVVACQFFRYTNGDQLINVSDQSSEVEQRDEGLDEPGLNSQSGNIVEQG
ncbi:hypothetical protein BD410DRAFT_804246 [Rickenella mellea]|uniref:Uncharacterized protein n=1 Tax=Rickenella mellea TaxID=50990 RepID=A0A4Y7Q2P7_9AGAM|nr:hypothetical protein BD410DRAFT_804246 [Rickenella mellea]